MGVNVSKIWIIRICIALISAKLFCQTRGEITLAVKMPYLPIYSGFILQMEGASQRPSREFDVDGVRNHCHESMLVIDGHLLHDSFDP